MIAWTQEEDTFIREMHEKQIYTWKELYELYCSKFGNNRSFYGFKSHASGRMNLRLKDRHCHSYFTHGGKSHPVGETKKMNGYWMTKVSNKVGKSGSHDAYRKNWVFTHRLIWEQHNGPILEGYSVMFLDGNHDNLKLSNLIAIPISIQGRVKAYSDPKLTLLAIDIARLDKAIKEKRSEL